MGSQRSIFRSIVVLLSLISMMITGVLIFAVVTHLPHLSQAARVIALVKSQALNEVSTAELIKGATVGMIEALDDPYSAYLEPEKFENLKEHIQGTYGGVGLLITVDQDRRLVVVSPFKGSPAHRAGISSGDWILKIGDQDTKELDLTEAANLMQGEPGTSVVLTVLRPEESVPREFELVREIIEIPTVQGEMLPGEDSIAYVNITHFTEQTDKELARTLKELQNDGFGGLILDLRSNPGGSLTGAAGVVSYFIPEGPAAYIVSKRETKALKTQKGKYLNVPLVVLVNRGSASASEIVAGAIKDTGSGILVGENTFGKGLVQTVFPLQGGAAVKLSTAKYLTPAKHDIHAKGISPHEEIKLTPEEEKEILMQGPDPAKDPQLKRAVEILQGKMN